jgi:hypothetical protein
MAQVPTGATSFDSGLPVPDEFSKGKFILVKRSVACVFAADLPAFAPKLLQKGPKLRATLHRSATALLYCVCDRATGLTECLSSIGLQDPQTVT